MIVKMDFEFVCKGYCDQAHGHREDPYNVAISLARGTRIVVNRTYTRKRPYGSNRDATAGVATPVATAIVRSVSFLRAADFALLVEGAADAALVGSCEKGHASPSAQLPFES